MCSLTVMASQLEVNHAEQHRVPGEAQPRVLSIIDTEMLGKAAGGILPLLSLFFLTPHRGLQGNALYLGLSIYSPVKYLPCTQHHA